MSLTNFEQLKKLVDFEGMAGFKLKPLQEKSIDELAPHRRTANFSEVGAGKTVVATALAAMSMAGLTVIICPPILIVPWVKWLKRFTNKVVDYRGRDRKLLDIFSYDAVVMSHAVFRKDNKNIQTWNARNIFLAVDEAQWLKNSNSVLFRMVCTLANAHEDNYLHLMTGTPTSKPNDAFSYIFLKTPKAYRSLTHFENLHVADRDFMYKQPSEWRGLEIINEHLYKQSVKYTKEEVHGYTTKPLFPDSEYELDKKHQALYEKMVDEQLLLLPDGTKIDLTVSSRLRHALQQVVVNYDYYSGDPTVRAAIFDMVDQTIEEAGIEKPGNSKLIIWTYYKRTSAKMLEYLKSIGIYAVGAYSEVDSNKSFQIFDSDEKCRILVAQPSSAGAGLNPQAYCWEALFAEMFTTPMLMTQSVGRLDRVGQLHVPRMRLAVARNTVQVRLHQMLLSNDDTVSKVENKKALREYLMGR